MEWKEVTLGEITNLVIDYRGKTPLKLGSSWSDSGFRALSAKNIKTGQIVAEDSIRFVDEELYRKWMKDEVKRGDILITSEAPFGQIYYWDSDEKIVLSQRLFDVRLNDEVCHKYVYYFMTSHRYQKDLEGRATGTTVTGLRQPELLKSTILLPPLSAQRSIASILSSLDRKIELNNKINADLEEMAQAIFKNWFVDFEPFKDGKFVDSELGMVPEGWKVGTLFDIAEIFDKKRKPLSGNVREKMDKIYPYYGATSCMDYVDDYIFDGIYTLIGEDGSVVKENGLPYMQYVWGKMWVNNHAHILQGKNGYSTEMIHALLSITNIKFLVTGAVQAKLSQGNMQKILVAIPPKNVLDEIRPAMDNLYKKIRLNTDESSRLSLLRDTLLPRLMSGELEVPE